MKKTAEALVVPTSFNALIKGIAFPKAGCVMVIETVLTIQMKAALKWCLHVAGGNSSVKMARVFISAGVVMAKQTAGTIQMS